MRRVSPITQDRAVAQAMASLRYARRTLATTYRPQAAMSANGDRPKTPQRATKPTDDSQSPPKRASPRRIAIIPLDNSDIGALTDSIEAHLRSQHVRAVLRIEPASDALLRAALNAVVREFGEGGRGLSVEQRQALKAARLAIVADNQALHERLDNEQRYI